MLLYLKHPAPEQEPGLTAMIDSIRTAGITSSRHFGTARELERLLTDDLAVLLSETFADARLHLGVSPPAPSRPGKPDGSELPAGTITFLLTDIEGSSRLWETEPEAMEVALQQHDRLLAGVIESHAGTVIHSRGEGDSFFAVFPSAVSAVEAAGACQLQLEREAWPTSATLPVRMSLHTGEVRVCGGDHVDYTPINRCAYDFVIGDHWRLALSVVIGLTATAALADQGLAAWWVLPAFVVVASGLSLRRARRKEQVALNHRRNIPPAS
jgi:class 3 adenylate cyclase